MLFKFKMEKYIKCTFSEKMEEYVSVILRW